MTDIDPATATAADTARARRARIARWALVAAAIACAGIVLAVALPRDQPIVTRSKPPSDGSIDKAAATGEAPIAPGFDPIAAVLSGRPIDPAAIRTGTGESALSEPPAGLPVYEGARMMLGRQHRESQSLEQTAIYAIRGADAEAVADFYERAAERGGFTLRPAAGATPLDRVYRGRGGTLLVKARTVGDEVRLTLILRAMTDGSAPLP